jgi:hypothetical protein
MLWHGDNAILAINISQLLNDGQRRQLVMIVDGQLQDSYRDSPLMNSPPINPSLPDNLPEPELQTMLRVANSVIKNVEESNVLNEALANRPRNVKEPYYKRSLLFTLALLAMAFVMWKLSANGSTLHPAMPNRAMQSAHALSAERKIESSEFGLSASMLARELCKDLTDSTDPAEWQRMLSGNAVTGTSLIRKKSLQKRMGTILNLALNTRTVHLSQRRFEQIGRTIVDLRQLHQNGQLQEV